MARYKFPFLIWLLYSVCFIALLTASLSMNDGKLVYALDDAYIHMAVAKNLVKHGVFGITRYEFSTPSSSPLWTFAVAALFFLFGVRDFIPLLMNYFLGLILLLYLFSLLRRLFKPWLSLLLLLLFALLLPLFPMIFSGMEHLLHILLVLAFFERLRAFLEKAEKRDLLVLSLLSFIATTVRLETLFLAGAAFVVLTAKRRPWAGFAVLLASGAGVLVPGLYYMAHSWPLLPASVLAKGDPRLWWVLKNRGPFHALLFAIDLVRVKAFKYFEVLLAGAVLGIAAFFSKDRLVKVLYIIYFLVLAGHSVFAQFGWFFRYEAYLVAAAFLLFIQAVSKMEVKAEREGVAVLLGVLLIFTVAFAERAAANFNTPLATHNIYTQQYQMAQFLRMFYQGRTVIANDIGAINYYADIHCVDTMGLSSLTVQKMWRGGMRNELLKTLSQTYPVDIAVIYEALFKNAIPEDWKEAGEWKIDDNIVCGSDRVSFFAVRDETLAQKLRIFSTFLPDVKERGYTSIKEPIFLENLVLMEAEASKDENYRFLSPGEEVSFPIKLGAGKYILYIKAKPTHGKRAIFTVRIGGSLKEALETISPHWFPYSLKFSFSRENLINLRLRNTSSVGLLIDRILILRKGSF